jgi:hypothetical protein
MIWHSSHHRAWMIGSGLAASVALLAALMVAPASGASSTTCRVTNKSSGVTHTQLKTAVKAARSGQVLTVKGRCPGRSSISKDLTIKGVRSPTVGRPILDGQRQGTVLFVGGGAMVTLRSLTVQGGRYACAIVNRGTLVLESVKVSGNKGGGIDNYGALTLSGRTIVSGNSASYLMGPDQH